MFGDRRVQLTHIDDVEFAHRFRVWEQKSYQRGSFHDSHIRTVVLSNGTGSAHVVLDPVEAAQPNIVQIHDRATRLHQVSTGIRTSRQSVSQELLVFGDEVLQLTLLGRQCVKLANVEFAETFDVDGAAVLIACIRSSRKKGTEDRIPCPSCGRIEGSTCQPRLVQGIQSSCSAQGQSSDLRRVELRGGMNTVVKKAGGIINHAPRRSILRNLQRSRKHVPASLWRDLRELGSGCMGRFPTNSLPCSSILAAAPNPNSFALPTLL